MGSKVKYRFPGMGVAKEIVIGMIINEWRYRAVVNEPVSGVLDKARANVSSTIKYILGMQQLVPKWVIFGPAKMGCLQWLDPVQGMVGSMIMEWIKGVNSNNSLLAQVLWQEYVVGKGKDVVVVREALKECEGELERIIEWGDVWGVVWEEWEPILYLVVDVTLDGQVWLGGVMWSSKGKELYEGRIRVAIEGMDSYVGEGYGLASMVLEVIQYSKAKWGKVPQIVASCDNQAALVFLATAEVEEKKWVPLMVVKAAIEMEEVGDKVYWCWEPAQRDTGRTNVMAMMNRRSDELARGVRTSVRMTWYRPKWWG